MVLVIVEIEFRSRSRKNVSTSVTTALSRSSNLVGLSTSITTLYASTAPEIEVAAATQALAQVGCVGMARNTACTSVHGVHQRNPGLQVRFREPRMTL